MLPDHNVRVFAIILRMDVIEPPSSQPSEQPTSMPSESPSAQPSCTPSMAPTPPEETFLFYPDWSPGSDGCKNDGKVYVILK